MSRTAQPASEPAPRARGRGRPAVGRDTPLTLDDILEHAQQIIRDHGLDALNMRRLAADLGVTAKALYNHVPDKAALLDALVSRLWLDIVSGGDAPTDDLYEWSIQTSLRTHRILMENLELASLAVGVNEPDAAFLAGNQLLADITRAAGYPNVPRAYYAMQTFTVGSVALAANRRRASTYFGRDPKGLLAKARRGTRRRRTRNLDDLEGLLDARFEGGDEEHFEASLRLLAAALLADEG